MRGPIRIRILSFSSPIIPKLKLLKISLSGILILVHSIALGAQNEQPGVVVDSSHHPIPYVTILNLNTEQGFITNARGEFIIPANFHPTDTLLFSRIGFQSKKLCYRPDDSQTLTVILSKNPVRFDPVSVISKSQSAQQAERVFLQLESSSSLGNPERNRILVLIPGLYVHSYGGPGGVSTLSLDGAPASHTRVTYFGFDLTSPQNNQIDLSQLPRPLLKRISYTPFITEENINVGNSEGSLDIQNTATKSGLYLARGSFGHTSIATNLSLFRKQFYGNILLGKRHDKGDYRVFNPLNNSTIKRENNHFDQQYISGNVNIRTRPHQHLRLILLQSIQDRGVPGLVWSPNPVAYRHDILRIGGLKYGRNHTSGYTTFRLLHRFSKEHYSNPINGIDARHRLNTLQTSLKHKYIHSSQLQLLGSLDAVYDHIASRNTGRHERISYKAAFSPTLKYHRIQLNPSLLYDYSPALYAKWNIDLNLTLRPKSLLVDNILLNYGRFYRYPSFNDLYWQPGGNPDLKSEKTQKWNIALSLNPHPTLRTNILFYYKSSRNLILWTPMQSYWQPKNIREARRYGSKMTLDWHTVNRLFSARLNLSYNVSEDRTPGDYYGKPLRYSPLYSGTIVVACQPRQLHAQFQIEYLSDRIAMYSWPQDIILEATTLVSSSISYSFRTRIGTFQPALNLENIFNTNYQTLMGYPEAGRALRFSTTYQLPHKRLKK